MPVGLVGIGVSAVVAFLLAFKYQKYLADSQPLLLSMASSFIVGVAILLYVEYTLARLGKQLADEIKKKVPSKINEIKDFVQKSLW